MFFISVQTKRRSLIYIYIYLHSTRDRQFECCRKISLRKSAPKFNFYHVFFNREKKAIQTQSSGISSVCNQDVTNQWENTVILHWRLPVQRYLSIYMYTITCKYTVQTMYCLCRASQQYNWCFGLYSLHTKHRDLCRIIKMTPGWSWPLRNTCLGADHSCDAEVWTGQ